MSVEKDFVKSIRKNIRQSGLDLGNPEHLTNMIQSSSAFEKQVVGEDEEEEEEVEGETKESTTSASSGAYSMPFVRNNLFQPGTESKLEKIPVVHENKLTGGLADELTIEDIAKKHKVNVNSIFKELLMGIEDEMEHTDKLEIAFEIAKDHIFTNPKYYTEMKKLEEKPKKTETKEATTSSSVGAYDVPFGKKNNPLQIDGEKSVYSSRAVKDPKFPKYGGKGGKYVKINDKCKKFPYCNQGDIKALQFFEHELVKKGVKNISEKYNISEHYILGVILENLDIYLKNNSMNNKIKSIVDNIVDKALLEEINKSTKRITKSLFESIKKEEVTKSEIDEMEEMEEFFENVKKKKHKPDFLDLDNDGDKKEPMKKAAKEKKATKEMGENEVEEGNEFTGELAKAKKEGKKEFEVDGKTYPVKESMTFTENELIDLIERIIKEEKIEGIKNQEDSRKTSKKFNDEYIKSVGKKMGDYLKKIGSKGKYEENPIDFPKGNGEMKKMDKKAFQNSDEANEFIEIYAHPGLTEIDYDIAPQDERVEMYLKGDSKTGNAEMGEDKKPNGNVVPKKELGEKLLKKYKEGKYQENKRKISYTRQVQPFIEKPFDTAGEMVNPKKVSKVNEEIDRIKGMFNFNYKSQ